MSCGRGWPVVRGAPVKLSTQRAPTKARGRNCCGCCESTPPRLLPSRRVSSSGHADDSAQLVASETQSESVAALAAVDLLLRHAREGVIPNLATEGDPYERAILLALFARSVPLSESIVRLGEDGYGREALMLNRPLFELMLDAYWTHANSELASERFVQHARFVQHLQRETAVRYPEFYGPLSPAEKLGDEELKRLKKIFGDFGHRSWTGLGTRARVVCIQSQFDEHDGDRGNLWFAFEVLNVASNAELHPSAWSLGRALRRLPNSDGGGEKLQFRPASEPELVAFALRQTWWIMGQILALVHSAWALPDEPLLEVGRAGDALIQAAYAEVP